MLISKETFRKFTFITTIAVYLLILVGGIVRNTGSGMGCPDWPKCFGSLIPPTSDEVLPNDYQNIYLKKRIDKTNRLAALLSFIGLKQTAEKVLNDPYLYQEDEFNVKTAWIEYINRLIGVVIGALILATAVTSIAFWKEKRSITVLAFAGLLLVIFQGWFGSLVVATNLIPGFVTIHMFLAVGQILLLVYLLFHSRSIQSVLPASLGRLSFVLFLLMIVQLYLGTQVRHTVDFAVFEQLDKSQWLKNVDWSFYVHRSLSLLMLLFTGILFYQSNFKSKISKSLKTNVNVISILIFVETIAGASMYYFDFPFLVQPLHLLIATLIIGLLFYLMLSSKSKVVNNI